MILIPGEYSASLAKSNLQLNLATEFLVLLFFFVFSVKKFPLHLLSNLLGQFLQIIVHC